MRTLPVIDRPLDNTALAAYMECPKKYDYSMRQHRRLGGRPPAWASFGTTWHAILEAHYKTGGDEWAAKNAGAEAWEDHGKPDDHRTLSRAWLEYDNYRKHWGERPELEDAQTLGYPEQPLVELSVNATWPGALHPYAGKIDRIVEWNGQLYVEDHKTASRRDSWYFSQYELDNQMMGYAWLAYHLTGRWIAGVRVNVLFILKRESEFKRETIPFSKARLEDWAENYNHWVELIERAYTFDEFPRNHKACAGKFGMCPYSIVCSVDPRIRQRVLETHFEINPWNPLEVKDADAGTISGE